MAMQIKLIVVVVVVVVVGEFRKFLEQIMPLGKYPSIFSRQMKAIVYMSLGVMFYCFFRVVTL